MPRSLLVLVLCVWLPAYGSDSIDALHAAAKSGDTETIRKLVASGVDVNAIKKGDGGTPLLTATNWNNYEAVKTLIALKASINFKVGQWTPLTRAVGRDTRIVKLLIESGADVNYADPMFGYTPLSSAAGNRRDTFERLTKSGGYVGPFPDSTETVRLLIKAGANVNHVDRSGMSPLRIAMTKNNIEIARLLLEAGADVNQRRPAQIGTQNGDTILMETVFFYPVFKNINAVKLLLDFKANPNDRNEVEYSEEMEPKGNGWRGYSVLGYAAKYGLNEVVDLLLKSGADPTSTRTDGKPPLQLAKENNQQKAAALIEAALKSKAP